MMNGKKLSNRDLSGSSKDLEDGYIHFSGEEQVGSRYKNIIPIKEI